MEEYCSPKNGGKIFWERIEFIYQILSVSKEVINTISTKHQIYI